MQKVKERLDKFMENIKKQNPNANWANLLTGLAVLVMVAVFSYAYFTKSKSANMVLDDSKLVEEVEKGKTTPEQEKDREISGEASKEEAGQAEMSQKEVPAQPGEKGATFSGETTVVQKGEGLWHVAQRVCGDGEKYNVLAAANGLTVWDELNEGMTLRIVCN